MAKNYSRGTLDCLVWDRIDDETGEALPPQLKPSVCKLLDGRQKHTPHRPESLNVTHFNLLGQPSPGATGWEAPPMRKGKRTRHTVKDLVIREDAAETDLKKDEPTWKKRVLGTNFLAAGDPDAAVSEAPPINKKKMAQNWDWQNREFNLQHSDEQVRTQIQQIIVAKSKRERQAKKELSKHLNTVSRFKAVNRVPARTVAVLERRHLPAPVHANVTRGRSPIFTQRVQRPATNCCESIGTQIVTVDGGHYHLPPRVPVKFEVPKLPMEKKIAAAVAEIKSPRHAAASAERQPAASSGDPPPEVFGTVEQVRFAIDKTSPRRVQTARAVRPQPPAASKPSATSDSVVAQQQRPMSSRVRDKIGQMADKFLQERQ